MKSVPLVKEDNATLHDAFGRNINYLRISVIDKCNMRCRYCMPVNGLKFMSPDELLTPEEIEMVARAAVNVGFYKMRLTGGEPTVRPEIVEIVERLGAIPQLQDLAMTTNGMLLDGFAEDLARAGLKRVNIHVDTVNAEKLDELMRWGDFDRIWAGIQAAEAAGLTPIKINSVVTRGYNDGDVVDIARLTLEHDWYVRFIELMPLGTGKPAQVAINKYVSNEETRDRVESALGELTPVPTENESDEAENFRLPGAKGIIGFISPVSNPYCETCNRMRLTADGKFHLCLLNDDEIDVKGLVRNGGGLMEIEDTLRRAVRHKPTGHALDQGVSTEEKEMFQIGG